jgi:hypothetical protein
MPLTVYVNDVPAVMLTQVVEVKVFRNRACVPRRVPTHAVLLNKVANPLRARQRRYITRHAVFVAVGMYAARPYDVPIVLPEGKPLVVVDLPRLLTLWVFTDVGEVDRTVANGAGAVGL